MWQTYEEIKKKNIAFLKAIKKHPLWGKLNIYKDQVQAFNSFRDHLSSAFEPQLPTFFSSKSILGVHMTKLDLCFLLISHKNKFGFYPKNNKYESRNETYI